MIAAGVDAGGTRTVAIAMRDGKLLRPCTGGAANPNSRGIAGAVQAICDAVTQACEGAAPDALVVGVAGAGRESTATALLAALIERLPSTRVAITDDAHIALRSAIPVGDGGLLVAGTGSLAYAEAGTQRYRAGGFGYLVGDEGSGYAIGSAAIRLLLRVLDKRAPADELTDAVAARVGTRDPKELVAYVYGNDNPVSAIAAFAPLVLLAAAEGERSASKIVQTAALDLFELLRAVWRDVKSTSSVTEMTFALAGGLLGENSVLSYLLETRVANDLPELILLKDRAEPHFGALAEARALLSDPQ